MNFNQYPASMQARNRINEMLTKLSEGGNPFEKIVNFYLFILFAFISITGLGYMLFREVRYIVASAPCPDPLKSPITGVVELDANNYAADNVIDCSAVDIEIQNGGALRILPRIVDNADADDDFGLVIQANSFTIDEGGLLDLEGQGYEPGQQASHIGSGKSSITTCSGGNCGGSGGGHGGAGGRGDPDEVLEANVAGESYGETQGPITLGSGGGESSQGIEGGSGGGAVKLEVSGAFTLNGNIIADGETGGVGASTGAGGGAGGSIWVEAGSFAGIGTASAMGGDGGTASKNGGGGGGGRVVMRCENANTYAGVVSVFEGEGGIQDGQIGTLIGPSCYPNDPENMAQYELVDNDPYTINEITDGERTKITTMVFKFDVSDIESSSTLYPQIELREVGQSFVGSATHVGANVQYTGTPLEASITIYGLSKTKEYKWQARVKDAQGVFSNWVEYEEDTNEEVDFIVLGNPALLVEVSGNGQTGTVGQQLPSPYIVELQDSAGHQIPSDTITWQVMQGGGSVSSSPTTTDTNGRTQTYHTLGTTSGIDNNRVNAIKTGVSGSPVTFTVSADPGALHHYNIDTPAVALISTDFDPDVVIKAEDQYNNLITTNNSTVDLSAVLAEESCPDTCTAGSGNITPTQATLSGGIISLSNLQYDTSEAIKIKADDGSITGYSNSINVITAYGSCFGIANDPANSPLIINENKLFSADGSNGGVINCSEIDLTIESGITVTLESDVDNALHVTLIAKSLETESGSIITSNYSGYLNNLGPGGGNDRYGGSYGGYGHGQTNANKIYGSVYEPNDLGSGGSDVRPEYGGIGGFGGGSIQIVVTNTFLHNGTVTVQGQDGKNLANSGGSGGSAGSIWIDTDVLNGTGTFLANGGNGVHGLLASGRGGGGGRIAVYYNSGNFPVTSTDTIQAYGGINDGATAKAGAGTVYVEQKGSDPSHGAHLYVDNNWTTDTGGKGAVIEGTYEFETVNLKRYGHLDILGTNSSLTVSSGSGLQGDNTSRLDGYGSIYLPDTITINNLEMGIRGDIRSIVNGEDTSSMDITIGSVGKVNIYASAWGSNGGFYEFDSMIINGGGYLYITGYDNSDTNWTNDYGIQLTLDTLNVQTGGYISGIGRGYGEERGQGGENTKGGSHGGYGDGQSAESKIYGSVYEPVDLGSSGGNTQKSSIIGYGGPGGSALKLSISSALTNDGIITMNGQDGFSGSAGGCGGAGGSLWIDTAIINGSGIIQANGGNGKVGSVRTGVGGSGGRIAVYYTSGDFPLTNVENIQAYGGYVNTQYGGAGTVYVEQKGVDNPHGAYLYVDNNIASDIGGKAAIIEDSYEFEKIRLTQYGHIDVLGSGSHLTISTENGMQGDNTCNLEVYGTLHIPDTVTVNNLLLGVRGDLASLTNGTDTSSMNITIGSVGKMNLYAGAWGSTAGLYEFESVIVETGGYMYLNGYDNGDESWEEDYGVLFDVDTITIQSGAYLSAKGLGFPKIRGKGAGSGGSHGGFGAFETDSLKIYDSVYEPAELGSGGNGESNGGDGGGAIHIVSETLTNNGEITADGNEGIIVSSYGGAGGSGGSIWIETNTFDGNGLTLANGGDGDTAILGTGGGGSGGRIAIYYEDGNYPVTDMNYVQTRGGATPNGTSGGAGTAYIEQLSAGQFAPSYDAELYVNNNNSSGTNAGLVEDEYMFSTIFLKQQGGLTIIGEDSILIITSGSGLDGDNSVPNLIAEGTLIGPYLVTLSGIDVHVKGDLSGFSDVNMGTGTYPANMTLYEKTWAHNTVSNHFTFQDVVIGSNSELRLTYGTEEVDYGENAQVEFDSLTIQSLGTVSLESVVDTDEDYTEDYGVTLIVNELAIDSGGNLHTDGLGYARTFGPGTGTHLGEHGGGAGHGGFGGNETLGGEPYGNTYEPSQLGSGSADAWYAANEYGTFGGGAIKLEVTNLTNDGIISANGAEDTAAGGAGGSIWIVTEQIDGSGVIATNGGNGGDEYRGEGGGSGGRIAIYYESGNFPVLNESNVQSRGGSSQEPDNDAGPGTVYVEQLNPGQTTPDYDGALLVSNHTIDGRSAGLPEATYLFSTIYQKNNGHLTVVGQNSFLTLSSESSLNGDTTFSQLITEGTLIAPDIFSINGVDIHIQGAHTGLDDVTIGDTIRGGLTLYEKTWAHTSMHDHFTFGDVTVGANSSLHLAYGNYGIDYGENAPVEFDKLEILSTGLVQLDSGPNTDTIYTDDYGATLIADTLTINTGGKLSGDATGYANNLGPGKGARIGGSLPAAGGGGYGGHGGDSGSEGAEGGFPYGDIYTPTSLGSGGGDRDTILSQYGGYGGGALKVETSSLTLNGTIHSNGDEGTAAGGSGGSIWIETTTISGSGYLEANGASTTVHNCGGGAGGRIALYYQEGTLPGDIEDHLLTQGGTGDNSNLDGGPGTVYIEHIGVDESGAGSLYIINSLTQNAAYGTDFEAQDYTFNDVFLGMNVKVRALGDETGERGPFLNINGDFTVETGALIDGIALGYSANAGHEPGGTGGVGGGGAGSGGGGGGHGGAGGEGESDGVNGETPGGDSDELASAVLPVTLGSGGGDAGTGAIGGDGGSAFGVISNAEDGVIQIKGSIHMDGSDGEISGTASGGGGAGGSIYLKACDIDIQSTGTLSAIGGNSPDATVDGGGGGGGIIALEHTCLSTLTIDPAATISVDEGTGYAAGGVGIYGARGLPQISSQDQYTLGDEQISIGGEIEERAVKFRIVVEDPDLGDNLRAEIEIEEANQGNSFDETNIIQADGSQIYSGSPLTFNIEVEHNGQGYLQKVNTNVLGITSDDLAYGGEYKWRARVYDVDDGFYSNWAEFASNGDNIDFQVAPLPSCGNGVAEGSEDCDGSDLRGQNCPGLGYDAGTLSCTGSCLYAGCYNYQCGNNTLEPGEICDGTDLGGQDCTTFGFDGGTLQCNGACNSFDTSLCFNNPVCGNSSIETGEQCDDGNTTNGDGCSSTCQLEGYGGYCGDGITQSGEGEECDDGNTTNGDGCNNTCQLEATDDSYCGDGQIDTGEMCDDGNQINGDGCSNICTIETQGYCGDGTIDANEDCDDGNQLSGDGCSNVCTLESGICGNGILERGEQCDGNELGDETCKRLGFDNGDLTCSSECTFVTEACTKSAICGNGIIEPGEQCDGETINSSCNDFFGYSNGRLICNNQCQLDFSLCVQKQQENSQGGLPITGKIYNFFDTVFQNLANIRLSQSTLSILSLAATGIGIFFVIISLLLAFPSLLVKEEHRPWGIVYNERTGKPVAFAVVRLLAQNERIAEKVTDLQGRYSFVVQDGTYTLSVLQDKYKPFEKRVTVKQESAGTVDWDVPLREGEVTGFSIRIKLKNFLSDGRESIPKMSLYFYIGGFLFSIVATIISPILFNFLVILFYILEGIFHILKGAKRGWGKVYDSSTKQGIGYVFVRVFDPLEKKLINTLITEKDGKYMFLIDPGNYLILAQKQGYRFPSQFETHKLVKTYTGDMINITHSEHDVLLAIDIPIDRTE